MSGKLLSFLLITITITAISTASISTVYGAEKKTETPSYSFSRQPNYPYTAGGDNVQLVDGIKITRNFWESYETVGWRDTRKVNIDFKFNRQTSLHKVCFGTASDERAEVRIPRSATIYTSADGNNYGYFGRFSDDTNTAEERYEKRTICISGAATNVKNAILYLETNGRYLFVDETEFFYDTLAKPTDAVLSAALNTAQIESNWQTQSDSYHDFIAYKWLSNRFLKSIETQPDSSRSHLEQLISDFLNDAQSGITASWSLTRDGLPSALKSIVIEALNVTESKKVRGRQTNPWLEHSPTDVFSTTIASTLDQDVSTYESGENAYVAANVAYSGAGEQRFSLQHEFDDECMRQAEKVLYRAMPVLRYDHHYSDDALVPISNKAITLASGDIVQIWTKIKANCSPGIYQGQLRLVSTTNASVYANIPLTLQITRVLATQGTPLQVNTWSYRATLPKTSTIAATQNDLVRHGVNIITIHPNDIPWPQEPCSSKAPCRIDATEFIEILKEYPTSTQFLLFMGFNNSLANREAFFGSNLMSAQWSTSMSIWATTLMREIEKAGIPLARIAFYPVDEPQDAVMSDLLTVSAAALHKATPRARVFGTYTGNQLSSVVSALASLDTVQVLLHKIANSEVASLRNQGKTIWTYTAEGGGKAADPTTFYRTQAWKAYANRVNGIGFWAYYDSSESTWNDFDGVKPDYSVIYETEHGFVSSKRWEAWSQGINDYDLLSYADSALTGKNHQQFESILAEVAQKKVAVERFMQLRKQLVDLLPVNALASPPQRTILKIE